MCTAKSYGLAVARQWPLDPNTRLPPTCVDVSLSYPKGLMWTLQTLEGGIWTFILLQLHEGILRKVMERRSP